MTIRFAAPQRSALVLAALVMLWALAPDAHARSWEMRVCADPDALPFSSRDGSGFENRIAAVLADHLDARLTYVWWPQGSTMIDDQLREGHCDLIMGIPDGFEGLLNTLAYYRSPYVFVQPADAASPVASLDDPLLERLEIGVQAGGIPPHDALVDRGLGPRVTLDPGRHVSPGRVVEAVAEGTVDVGLAWGPVAGWYAPRQDVPLTITPVSPEFDRTGQAMVLPMTMGLRPGDDAFRDRLNAAVAARWDEVQEILDEFEVPRTPLPVPSSAPPPADDAVRVGLVTPTASGLPLVTASVYDVVGDAARMGAILAEEEAQGRSGADAHALVLLPASAPSAEAAVRAAERLISTEGVHAVVGGLSEGQAEELARIAHERSVLFLNVGSPDLLLRRACRPHVFHLQADAGAYLDALVLRLAERGVARPFVVHEATPEGERRAERARAAVEHHLPQGALAGTASVEVARSTYFAVLDAARESGADAILLLLDARDQLVFLNQVEQHGLDAVVAAFPDPVTQTRDYLAATRLRTGGGVEVERVALWDPGLDPTLRAAELNERFAARWGQPMDPSAWAAYAAVRMVEEAAAAVAQDRLDAAAIGEGLAHAASLLDLGKEDAPRFDERQQLRQPLYSIRVDLEADWSRSVSDQVGFVEVVAEVPVHELGAGVAADRGACPP